MQKKYDMIKQTRSTPSDIDDNESLSDTEEYQSPSKATQESTSQDDSFHSSSSNRQPKTAVSPTLSAEFSKMMPMGRGRMLQSMMEQVKSRKSQGSVSPMSTASSGNADGNASPTEIAEAAEELRQLSLKFKRSSSNGSPARPGSGTSSNTVRDAVNGNASLGRGSNRSITSPKTFDEGIPGRSYRSFQPGNN